MAADSSPKKYIKIWAILLVLFAISVIGPIFEIKWLTLITAFGVAIVKAYLVAKEFMHLDIEKKVVLYMLGSMILAMGLFYYGTAADIMKPSGQNWERVTFDK